MANKKKLILLLFFILTSSSAMSAPMVSQDSTDLPNISQQDFTNQAVYFVGSIIDRLFGGKRPEWFNRISGGFSSRERLEPNFYLETIQPLYQSVDRADTWFIQSRFNYEDNDKDYYNLGTGYRHYLKDLNALAGLNFFGDYQRYHSHGRLGIGAEILSPYLDFRANSYIGVTPRRQVDSPIGGPVYEKVADGLDFELGTPLPYIPIIKIYGGGNIYFFEEVKNTYEWHWRLEVKPWTFVTANIELFDGANRSPEWRVDVRMNLDFDDKRFWNKTTSERPYVLSDARERSLDRVERENRLIKESYGEGLSFFVAKK